MNRLIYIIIGVVILTVSCKPQVPKGVIQPDKMEDVLVDYHLAKAMATQNYDPSVDRDYRQQLYIAAVFRKHGITQADFDSSMIYYYSRADKLSKMYRRVSDRLDKKALSLGATEGAIGRYASLNSNGDTANIWTGNLNFLLSPIPPRNRVDFEIEVDSTFRKGDTFLLQFYSDYVYQSGMKEGMVLMSIDYEGDTIVSRFTHFTVSGINQLRFEGLADLMPKRLRGFFYLGGGNTATTTLRLLYLRQVQLIRFHRPEEAKKADEKDENKNTKERKADDSKTKKVSEDSVSTDRNRRRTSVAVAGG